MGRARNHLGTVVALATLLGALFPMVSAQASFGVASLTATATNRDGTLDFQAGSHPYEYTVAFAMEQDAQGEPEAPLRAIVLNLPPGLGGNPLAVPRCPRQLFEGVFPKCPGNTQVGVVHAELVGLGDVNAPLYNLVPPPGVVASFGFGANGFNGFEQGFLRAGGDYGLSLLDAPVSNGGLLSLTETIWGVPADPEHDAERVCIGPGGDTEEGCGSDAPPAPLLTLPTDCAGPLETTIEAESLFERGVFAGRSALSLDAGGNPAALIGCEQVPFAPTIAVQLKTSATDSPAGLSADLHLPQTEGSGTLATAALRGLRVALPAGVAVDPSAATGLAACSPAQIGLETPPGFAAPAAFTPDPANCSAAARIGTVAIETPLVDHTLLGGLYLATPVDNPLGALIALYLVVDDPQSGIVLKLPGLVEADPRGGQLIASFADTPQLPFEDIELELPDGPRAALTTPSLCGVYRMTSTLTPWTGQAGTVVRPSALRVVAGPGGSACSASEAQLANDPSFAAGTQLPHAGAYSPFVLRLGRDPGSQSLGRLSVSLPPGLSARLTGVRECGAAQIAAAEGRGEIGGAALELASPSCPQASEVGSLTIGAGAGQPAYLSGHAYLAGPYKGAPLSLAFLVPALTGPFDLGTVVVRAALQVDPETAQLSLRSDPFPKILHGIPLDVRSVAVDLDRREFIRNPTSCEPAAVRGESISAAGAAASLFDRFQVGGCAGLGLKPRLTLRLIGPAHRGAHPRLRATVEPRAGDANLKRLALTLPPTELLDNAHIRGVCVQARFVTRACPPKTAVGNAKVWSPLLDRPLAGPVYLRASAHRLPDLAVALDGQIRLDVVGRLSSVGGRLRVAFPALPDMPVGKLVLTLLGGRRGLLVNSGGVCRGTRRADASLAAQNGKGLELGPLLRTDCTKAGKKK